MKKILLAISLTITLNAGVDNDKFKHAFAGSLVYAGCLVTKGVGEKLNFDMSFLTMRTCLIPVFAAGIGKELYDRNHDNHTAEWQDVAATVAIPVAMDFVIYEW